MTPQPPVGPPPVARGDSDALDADSRRWVRDLAGTGLQREAAVDRLHALLLAAARSECHRRRGGSAGVAGPELDDVAHQAAADAVIAVLGKLDAFRGASRFTTWAYKFAMFEVSAKLARHAWRSGVTVLDDDAWGRLPDRLATAPEALAEQRDLLHALRAAVEDHLTAHQRRVFVAVVVDEVPIDALALDLGTTRNAVYKTLHDARRKLRAQLSLAGHPELAR